MRNLLAFSRIESLESRIAPASLVTVTFAKGALGLVGDAAAHDFTITALDAVTTQLKAATGALFHMDGLADSDTLLLTGTLKSLTATLGDAADHLGLVGLNIGGDVTIHGGLGANVVDADTVAIKGGLQITGGADADTVNVLGGNFSVKKNFTLELGDGANTLSNVTLFQVGKDLTYTGGSGMDTFTTTLGSTTVGGNFLVTLGAGSASIGVNGINTATHFTVGKKFAIDSTGSLAGDMVALGLGGYSTKIGGDIHITDGAGNLTFQAQTVATIGFHGKIFVETGPGTSGISFGLYQFLAKAITIDASASSASSFTLGGFGASFTTAVNYTGGSGADQVSIQSYGSGGSSLGTSLIANLGDGANQLNVASLGGFFKTVKLTSGAGDDSISVAALGAKTGLLDIQTGGGTDQTQLAFINSTISGKISVANAATAIKGSVALGFLDSVVGSLDINLSGDGNQVKFGASPLSTVTNGLTVKKAIHVVTGGGADTVDFSGVTNVKASGGLKLELGDGTNSVTGPVVNFTAKSFTVIGGSGADTVTLAGSGSSLGAVALTLGAGVNGATITGGTAPLALASLTFGSASATGVADSLTLARVIVAGKVDATFGAGASTFLVDDSIINGTFNADTGAGADLVKLDTTATYTGTVLAKAATLHLGDDSDTLVLGGNGTNSLLTTKATFSADGGTGMNTLTNAVSNVFAKTPSFAGF